MPEIEVSFRVYEKLKDEAIGKGEDWELKASETPGMVLIFINDETFIRLKCCQNSGESLNDVLTRILFKLN